jgi:hypothetical protein
VTATDSASAVASDTLQSGHKEEYVYGTDCCDLIITCCDNDLIYALNGCDNGLFQVEAMTSSMAAKVMITSMANAAMI